MRPLVQDYDIVSMRLFCCLAYVEPASGRYVCRAVQYTVSQFIALVVSVVPAILICSNIPTPAIDEAEQQALCTLFRGTLYRTGRPTCRMQCTLSRSTNSLMCGCCTCSDSDGPPVVLSRHQGFQEYDCQHTRDHGILQEPG